MFSPISNNFRTTYQHELVLTSAIQHVHSFEVEFIFECSECNCVTFLERWSGTRILSLSVQTKTVPLQLGCATKLPHCISGSVCVYQQRRRALHRATAMHLLSAGIEHASQQYLQRSQMRKPFLHISSAVQAPSSSHAWSYS